MSLSDSLTPKTHPLESNYVSLAIIQPKLWPIKRQSHSYSKLSPKVGCHGNVPQYLWTPIQHMISTAYPSPHPNGIPIGSAVFAQTTVECPYTLQWDAHSSPKICPFPWGDLDPHLIHGSRAHPSPQPKRQIDRCSRFCRAH